MNDVSRCAARNDPGGDRTHDLLIKSQLVGYLNSLAGQGFRTMIGGCSPSLVTAKVTSEVTG